jgi:DNA polymerase/3'-5' exonuclease PolX
MNYSIAKSIADYLVGELSPYCLPDYCRIAGGLRREKADVHDIEIVCISKPGAPRPEFGQKRILASHLEAGLYRLECEGRLGRREKDGPKYKKISITLEAFGVRTLDHFFLDLFIVRPETWGYQFTVRTGPAEFSHKLVTKQDLGGWLPGNVRVEDALLWDVQTDTVIPTPEEADFLRETGLPWIEPRDRQTYLEKNQ